MAKEFPSDRKSYLGTITFVAFDDSNNQGATNPSESCVLYLPIGVQIADKMEYENAGIGFTGGLVAGDNNITEVMSDGALTDVGKLGVAALTSKLSDNAGAGFRARNKLAPNPNTRALFKQVNLRSFQLTFKLIPESPQDAENIPEIIKYFRKEMYPKDVVIGSGIAGYKFPKKFLIFMQHPGTVFPYIAPCFLESFMTNYNPTNGAFLSSGGPEGKPSEVDISMTFTEARTLNADDIEAGY